MLCLTVHYFCSILGIHYLTMSTLEMLKAYFITPSNPFFKKTRALLPEVVLLSSLKINAL